MPPSNKKKQLNNSNNTITDNTITDNTNTIQTKSIDNFFGIIIDKPPSPINIINEDKPNENLQNNLDLNIINNITDNKKIIYSNIELKNKIELLSEHEVLEVFRIIKNNKEKYSTNNNGIFINISTLKKVSIQEISNFILFCENNNKILEREEEQRKIYRELVAEN